MNRKAKQELRQDIGRVLKNLDDRWTRVASHELSDRLSELINDRLPGDIDHILTWSGVEHGEPSLSAFVEQQVDSRDLYFPTFFEEGKIKYQKIDTHLFMSTKIPSKSLVSEVEFDIADAERSVIILPGLAFDLMGNRLGWGELHYERFLSNSRLKSMAKVGIAWSLQMVKEVPVESTDLLMDWVVTEREIFSTGVQFEID